MTQPSAEMRREFGSRHPPPPHRTWSAKNWLPGTHTYVYSRKERCEMLGMQPPSATAACRDILKSRIGNDMMGDQETTRGKGRRAVWLTTDESWCIGNEVTGHAGNVRRQPRITAASESYLVSHSLFPRTASLLTAHGAIYLRYVDQEHCVGVDWTSSPPAGAGATGEKTHWRGDRAPHGIDCDFPRRAEGHGQFDRLRHAGQR